MTKEAFLAALRAEILARYGQHDDAPDGRTRWARDPSKVEDMMARVIDMLSSPRNSVCIQGPSFLNAWRSIGGKGQPTYKALRALA